MESGREPFGLKCNESHCKLIPDSVTSHTPIPYFRCWVIRCQPVIRKLQPQASTGLGSTTLPVKSSTSRTRLRIRPNRRRRHASRAKAGTLAPKSKQGQQQQGNEGAKTMQTKAAAESKGVANHQPPVPRPCRRRPPWAIPKIVAAWATPQQLGPVEAFMESMMCSGTRPSAPLWNRFMISVCCVDWIYQNPKA